MTFRVSMAATAIAAGLVSILILNQPAAAQSDIEKFFTGKQINFLIGSAPGGGYGIYGTALAHHIGKHLPGKPTIVGRNLEGAGSLIAANQLYNKSPKDGTTFGALFMGAIVEPLIGDAPNLQFDARKFEYIGSANRESSICIAWNESPVHSFKDMFEKELIVGASGKTSSIQQYPTILNNVLGTKFKVVSGYPGSREAGLAVERGEAGGICGMQWTSFKASFPRWLDEKKATIIVQMGSAEGDPELNALGVPKIWEFVKNDDDRKTLAAIFSQMEFGRPYVLPPGVPADRVAAYRKAFDDTMKDPEFLAEAKKLGLDIDPLTGAQVQKVVDETYATPPALVARAKEALK